MFLRGANGDTKARLAPRAIIVYPNGDTKARLAPRPSCPLRCWRLLLDRDLDAAVLVPAGLGLVVGQRQLGAVALRDQPLGVDALLDQVLDHHVGARLRAGHVRLAV